MTFTNNDKKRKHLMKNILNSADTDVSSFSTNKSTDFQTCVL